MVQITLTITESCSGEAGTITLKRTDGAGPKEMGKIKFDYASDKRWLLEVLMERHPYVTLADSHAPCDPSISKDKAPC